MTIHKKLEWRTLVDDGYLQEVNRGFFHPLGLALCVTVEDDKTTATLSVLDARDDPEGYVFSPEGGDLTEKAAKVRAIAAIRRPAREKALGYWQQPATNAAGFTEDQVAEGFESKLDTER